MRKSTETLSRQWTLLRAIPSPGWKSTRELHDRMVKENFVVSMRTTQRDLDWLSAEFPLESQPDGKANHWRWMPGAHGLEIPGMSRTTALVFQQANRYLRQLMPADILSLLDPYFKRADKALADTRLADWSNSVMHVERGPQFIVPKIVPAIRDVVYQALLEGSRFDARYVKRYDTSSVSYEVNPLGIVTRESLTYLVCTLWNYADIRQLALHRLQSATLLDKEATTIDGFSLEKYVHKESAFGFPESPGPVKLKALFDEGAAFHLTERRLSEDQLLKELPDGCFQLTATVADTSELRWWLLGFGDGVEVVAPKKLREEFRKMTGSMAQMYL